MRDWSHSAFFLKFLLLTLELRTRQVHYNDLNLMSIPDEWQASWTWRQPWILPYQPDNNTEHEEDNQKHRWHHFYELVSLAVNNNCLSGVELTVWI